MSTHTANRTQPNTAADQLLPEAQAAELLGIAQGTLGVWRCTRRVALPYVKIGRAVRYRRSDLERFIAANTVAA